MAYAICFKCGARKAEPFDLCKTCRSTPCAASDRTVSLVLSTYVASDAQLAEYKGEILQGVKPSIPMGALSKAIEGLKNGLGNVPNGAAASSESAGGNSTIPRQAPNQAGCDPAKTDTGRVWKPFGASIDNVPFAVLGATPRDTRKRIVELAEERSLELDPVVCQKARSDLTNPRTRLSAEVAWFPGLSPGKIVKCIGELHDDPMSIRGETGLPPLAHFNLMAYALETVNEGDGDSIGDFVCEVSGLAEDVDSESVLRDVNEDRQIAKFPPVQAVEQVDAALSEHKDRCRGAVKRALNALPSATLVHALTVAVDTATDSGETPAPKLLDDLIDSYAVEVQAALDMGASRIRRLVAAVKSSVGNGAPAVDAKIAQLEVATRKWDAIAQPIQLSYKARGMDHEVSHGLANEIRSLAVDLFNSHDLLVQAQRITELLQEIFAELPDVSEQLEEDADALEDVAEKRQKSEVEQREWEQKITYSADVGAIFKNRLSIGRDGIVWKGQQFQLASVSLVRWGGVRHSTNGIPTGTTYTIGFGSQRSSATVELKKQSIYAAFTDKLWQAVCTRLVWELLEGVKEGKQFRFGTALIRDDGLTLTKHRFLGSNESVPCGWHDVHVWSQDGSLYIGRKADKKTYVGLSYISDWNTHILEAAIRSAFKKGINKLSDVLS